MWSLCGHPGDEHVRLVLGGEGGGEVPSRMRRQAGLGGGGQDTESGQKRKEGHSLSSRPSDGPWARRV